MKRQPSLVAISPAVFPVADDRMAYTGEMDANLVLAAGQKVELQQSEISRLLEHPIARAR